MKQFDLNVDWDSFKDKPVELQVRTHEQQTPGIVRISLTPADREAAEQCYEAGRRGVLPTGPHVGGAMAWTRIKLAEILKNQGSSLTINQSKPHFMGSKSSYTKKDEGLYEAFEVYDFKNSPSTAEIEAAIKTAIEQLGGKEVRAIARVQPTASSFRERHRPASGTTVSDESVAVSEKVQRRADRVLPVLQTALPGHSDEEYARAARQIARATGQGRPGGGVANRGG